MMAIAFKGRHFERDVILSGVRWYVAYPISCRSYDRNWFRNALVEQGTTPCIPGRKNRKQAPDFDKTLYRQRHKIENMFAKLKDWRRIATRYDRCAHTFFSAICITAPVVFYLKE
jgi:transposase